MATHKKSITRPARRIARSRKAITPIIAVIMLLMMAVATASAMYYWLNRIQTQQQGAIESYQSGVFENLASNVDIIGTKYIDGNQTLELVVQNTGNTKIVISNSGTKPTTEWAVFDADQKPICATDWSGTGSNIRCLSGCGTTTNLDTGQIRRVLLNLTSSDCSVQYLTNGTTYVFEIGWSGKTKSAGSFVK